MGAVERMKMKLAQIGLNPQTADEELEFSESGEFDLNFSRYGEIIGKTGRTVKSMKSKRKRRLYLLK